MNNNEIRRKILQILYESFTEHPYNRVTPKEFKDTLNISLKELHFNIIYLEEKGYVELSKPLEGSVFVGARITPRGVDLVEDECEFNVHFPLQPTTRHVSTDILRQFDALSKQASELTDLGDDSKELIIEEIRSIQDELNKSEPIYSEIKKNVDRIKERNFDTWQKLIEILRDPVITTILSHAARNELGI
ncbi:MAG: transcriptional regulator [candidate division WOR-3 bacterium]|nr:transcriptional regulator [candidate division WOR-3 bacterium]